MPFKNKELAKASSRKAYANAKIRDPDFLKKLNVKARVRNIARPQWTLLRSIKRRAKGRNIPFNLELSDIILPDVCPVFKTKFVYGTPYTASVDRIIPALGYVKGNIQIISNKANIMKSNASAKELKEFATWVQNRYTN